MASNEELFFTQQLFQQINQLEKGTRKTTFEGCSFKNCDFSQENFKGCNFINCEFDACNLSMVKFKDVALDGVTFKHSKLIGVDFSIAKDFLFSVHFSDCILDYATFVKKKNKRAKFINCALKGADFSGADLTLSVFSRCDLSGAVFGRTMLAQVDFSEAYNFSIDPELNNLRKAIFSQAGLSGLLHKYDIVVV